MGLSIFFIILLSILVGMNISVLVDQIRDERYGSAMWTFFVIVLCCTSIALNVHTVYRDTQERVVKTRQAPQVDTLITSMNGVSDTTYVIDLSKLPEAKEKNNHQ